MSPAEQGFLLLTSHLGNPDRRPLTPPQLRLLTRRMELMSPPKENRELTERDLHAIGMDRELSGRILSLLEERDQLAWYLQRAKKFGCVPIPRSDCRYPARLRRRLGAESTGCLWAKGDLSLLETPCISLVGSRELLPENRDFARQVGLEAARQGYTLVSGNARGADTEGQEACLASGGKVICVIADALETVPDTPDVLYLSEEDFDAPFSPQRALHRNHVIHALGSVTIAAQCRLKRGGTWNGSEANLRHGFSPLCCFRDGSEAAQELEQMGATLIGTEELSDLKALCITGSFFENPLPEDF